MAKSNRLHYIGFPVALVYGIVVWIRNLFFHINLLPSQQYAIPVICIGNLSMGGAGKTRVPDTSVVEKIPGGCAQSRV